MKKSIEFLYSKFLLSNGVSIDTRTLQKDNLFFAINGPNFNANKFAIEALEKGASFAVVDDCAYATNDNIIFVEDGLKIFQALASFHRLKFKHPVIGITGSNGKTTTKELIQRVLSETYIVHATKGNYNNHIGVPLTLLGMRPQTEITIIEMGANHLGEIANSCEMAKPTHGLITNIGRAHTKTFGGIAGVIRGKSELFDFLLKTGGIPFINKQDTVLSNMSRRFKTPILFPQEDFKLTATHPFLTLNLAGVEKKASIVGKYNFLNMAAGVAVGRHFEISDLNILKAISLYTPDNARSQIIKKGTTMIILDAYNANTDSMRVALENLSLQGNNTVAILGDMNELENEDDQYREVLDYAKKLKIKQLLTIGEGIGKIANPAFHFDTKETLEKKLQKMNFSKYTVLLKASRSMQLETILKSIT